MEWNSTTNTLMMMMIIISTAIAMLAAATISWMLLRRPYHNKLQALPPGRLGVPIAGETLEFLRMMRQNRSWEFIADRVRWYGTSTFKTSLFGWKTVVVASPAGNKMAFANINTSWPSSVVALIGRQALIGHSGRKAQRIRTALHSFLNANALRRYIHPVSLAVLSSLHTHIVSSHSDLQPPPPSAELELLVYPFMVNLTFAITCRILIAIPHLPALHDSLLRDFAAFSRGVFQLPIRLPGTRYSIAMAAAHTIKQKLQLLIDRKRQDLAASVSLADLETAAADDDDGILSCLLTYEDEDGNPLSDEEITDNLLTLLFAGTDTSSVAVTMVCKYLALHPTIMEEVCEENKEVAAAMAPARESLRWEDLQKLKLTWRVVQETMRLQPPSEGSFRVATEDMSFDGYRIPKSWKILWTPNSTRKDPKYFPEPDKFDPSRFEGAGPAPYTFVPFGGGPRMCPGNEFARMEILIIIHYMVTNFSWTLKDPEERITVDPMPVPVKGLPILLRRRSETSSISS